MSRPESLSGVEDRIGLVVRKLFYRRPWSLEQTDPADNGFHLRHGDFPLTLIPDGDSCRKLVCVPLFVRPTSSGTARSTGTGIRSCAATAAVPATAGSRRFFRFGCIPPSPRSVYASRTTPGWIERSGHGASLSQLLPSGKMGTISIHIHEPGHGRVRPVLLQDRRSHQRPAPHRRRRDPGRSGPSQQEPAWTNSRVRYKCRTGGTGGLTPTYHLF